MDSKLYSFRESSLFTADVYRYLTDESYFAQQDFLLEYPMEGDLIPGSGGLRKLRWKVEGRGKRGGARIIYYFVDARGHIYLLDIYLKTALVLTDFVVVAIPQPRRGEMFIATWTSRVFSPSGATSAVGRCRS